MTGLDRSSPLCSGGIHFPFLLSRAKNNSPDVIWVAKCEHFPWSEYYNSVNAHTITLASWTTRARCWSAWGCGPERGPCLAHGHQSKPHTFYFGFSVQCKSASHDGLTQLDLLCCFKCQDPFWISFLLFWHMSYSSKIHITHQCDPCQYCCLSDFLKLARMG